MANHIRLGLLGTGRTGGRVIDIYGQANVTAYDTDNPPTIESLKQNDALISFLPGPALLKYIDMIIDSGVPLASGSTGLDWPNNIDKRLKERSVAWVTASNFALGMSLVEAMIKVLAKAPKLFDKTSFKIHEVHHIHKKDDISGTALTWQKWLGHPAALSSERIGEIIGNHSLTALLQNEDITISHHAKDRKIYAEGAIWTAEKLARGGIKPGLHQLSEITRKELDL